MRVEELLALEGYSLAEERKAELLTERLRELTLLHYGRCPPYRRILDGMGCEPGSIASLEEVPMLPVGLFKSHVLRSIPQAEVFKVITSSGTTGVDVSRIYLDAAAARLQTQSLAAIMTHWLGSARLPMLVVDSRSTIAERHTFGARRAGIVGMTTFGRDHFFALDDEMRLDRAGLRQWLLRHRGAPILLFGYTFLVWQHLVEELEPGEIDLSDGILIHTGGWKRLTDRAVSRSEYAASIERATGLRRIHDFYGMAEQIGTVFVECEHGHLHAPNASDILVRDPADWSVAEVGEVGVAQMLSVLPGSYPGHSILTEDLARVETVDGCPCGRLGRAVSILGRVPRAEARGCSDTRVLAA